MVEELYIFKLMFFTTWRNHSRFCWDIATPPFSQTWAVSNYHGVITINRDGIPQRRNMKVCTLVYKQALAHRGYWYSWRSKPAVLGLGTVSFQTPTKGEPKPASIVQLESAVLACLCFSSAPHLLWHGSGHWQSAESSDLPMTPCPKTSVDKWHPHRATSAFNP